MARCSGEVPLKMTSQGLHLLKAINQEVRPLTGPPALVTLHESDAQGTNFDDQCTEVLPASQRRLQCAVPGALYRIAQRAPHNAKQGPHPQADARRLGSRSHGWSRGLGALLYEGCHLVGALPLDALAIYGHQLIPLQHARPVCW